MIARFILAVLVSGAVLVPTRAAEPIVEHALPGTGQRPQAIVVGPDGNVWVTEVLKRQIIRITPKGDATAFAVPGKDVGVLQGLAVGPDGNLWFTSREENAIRRITLKGEFDSTFPIPSKAVVENKVTKGTWPRGITAGPDGNLWFAEMTGNKIGRITPKGEITEYPVPTDDAQPYGVVTGPDKMIWFTESATGKIGRLNPKTGKIEEFRLADSKARPRDITNGPDGNLWFSENGADRISRITPKGEVSGFELPKGTQPIGIATGGDGNVWFTAFKTHKIGRITPAGKLSWFDLKTENAQPFGMTAGPDGTVWFTEQANRVGQIDTKNAGK
ncbi:Virginiamycin B lyase OS=Streptococcus gallolyticus GN=vgb PE=3 SV=1 [Gemmata massiliana]|uniref:Virginiamycin B lyase n=1 Tax=Gemmata massiliana TaxID=1210884 RepID=A0A6P2DCW7_9BACT|nr:Virginiamycin B lyase [Gemmata massiliana]VTR98683.1 Virginiamycin B lyase OS=Streptococcus gallolyticus GN=vgb PE=3 SV=1 [Gemmata massiliana]